MATQFQHTLSFEEIEQMRQHVLSLVSSIHSKKHRIMSHDHRQLNNHLQYVLTTLSNMHNIMTIEKSDPYGSKESNYTQVTGMGGRKLVYNADGTTRVITSSSIHNSGEDWEKQFDEGLLQKAPCFQIPPQSMTSIRRIRQAGHSEHDMKHNL